MCGRKTAVISVSPSNPQAKIIIFCLFYFFIFLLLSQTAVTSDTVSKRSK